MPFRLGSTELIILFLIIVLLFGAGRISKLAHELGSGIRAFRSTLASERDDVKHDDGPGPG